MKKKVIIPITFWATMIVSLYGATFAEVSINTKIASGIAFATLYTLLLLLPYFEDRRKGSKETLHHYLMSFLEHE